MRKALAGVALTLWLAVAGPAHGAPRLLYASDWSGTSEIYAADPTGSRPTMQITFGRAPACGVASCGYRDPVPSPDGKYVAYSDWASCDGRNHPPSLYVARADGTHARRIGRSTLGFSCVAPIKAIWAPDSRRIAYTIDGALDVARIGRPSVRWADGVAQFAWSPDGKSLAYTTARSSPGFGSLWTHRNGRARMIAAEAASFAWSPDARWLAYDFPKSDYYGPHELDIVRPDGAGRRLLLAESFGGEGWSADSRFVATGAQNGLTIIDVVTGRHVLGPLMGGPITWQPRGHRLAAWGDDGMYLYDVDSGATRLLVAGYPDETAWSRDGRSLAYVTRTSLGTYIRHDLRVVDLSGTVRTVVRSSGQYGGSISGAAWTRTPTATHYRRPQARVLATVRDDGLTAPWPVVGLAADGGRVAYVSCGHVFVWTPSTRAVVQSEPATGLSPHCTLPGYYEPYLFYTLALSADRIAFGDRVGNAGQSWGLYTATMGDNASFVSLGSVGSANGCAVGNGGLGDLVGAGGLLVFSTWRDDFDQCHPATLEQQIHRIDADGCPCPVIAAAPGPLVPFDIDAGRIVAGGSNATVVFDAQGTQLASIPISPLAAQLSGTHVVILVQGQLLDYDATTAGRLHAWPLPDVASGGECRSPHSGTWECRGGGRLLLEDAARGLVTYVLDGQVHLLRLADGADATVGAGAFARFMDAGLVYADGPELHLVRFDALPLR